MQIGNAESARDRRAELVSGAFSRGASKLLLAPLHCSRFLGLPGILWESPRASGGFIAVTEKDHNPNERVGPGLLGELIDRRETLKIEPAHVRIFALDSTR